MRTFGRVLIPLVMLAGAAVPAAQSTWLAPDLEVALTTQLNSRLSKTRSSPAVDESSASGAARFIVRGLATTLGSWSDAEAVDRAPSFPSITLPRASQRHIDAMARYQVCSMMLLGQFETGKDVAARRKAALGLTAMTMAIERLRAPLMSAGGTDKDLHAFLTGPSMVSALDDIRKKPELVAHVERQCAPVLQLLSKPGL